MDINEVKYIKKIEEIIKSGTSNAGISTNVSFSRNSKKDKKKSEFSETFQSELDKLDDEMDNVTEFDKKVDCDEKKLIMTYKKIR